MNFISSEVLFSAISGMVDAAFQLYVTFMRAGDKDFTHRVGFIACTGIVHISVSELYIQPEFL